MTSLKHRYQQELTFFKAFHQHALNKLIHALTIPLEWFGWTVLLALLPPLHWLMTIFVAGFILLSGANMSLLAAVMHVCMAMAVDLVRRHLATLSMVTIAIGVQLVSWTVQVAIGHKMLEKNNPAMATKLTVTSVLWSTCIGLDTYFD